MKSNLLLINGIQRLQDGRRANSLSCTFLLAIKYTLYSILR